MEVKNGTGLFCFRLQRARKPKKNIQKFVFVTASMRSSFVRITEYEIKNQFHLKLQLEETLTP